MPGHSLSAALAPCEDELQGAASLLPSFLPHQQTLAPVWDKPPSPWAQCAWQEGGCEPTGQALPPLA